MDSDTRPEAARYVRCGKCARCVSGTGRRPDPLAVDCYDAWLRAATTRRPA